MVVFAAAVSSSRRLPLAACGPSIHDVHQVAGQKDQSGCFGLA